jgi:hypothetical protein
MQKALVSFAGMSVQMGCASTSIYLMKLIPKICICQKLMEYTTHGYLSRQHHSDLSSVDWGA